MAQARHADRHLLDERDREGERRDTHGGVPARRAGAGYVGRAARGGMNRRAGDQMNGTP